MIDWFNDNSAAIQAVSVVALVVVTGFYAWFTLRLARSSRRIVEGTLRPVIIQWMNGKRGRLEEPYAIEIRYSNVGNGPALNIRWSMEPAKAEWKQTPERVGIAPAPTDISGELRGTVTGTFPSTLRAEYEDVFGSRWCSTLVINATEFELENGKASVTQLA